MKMNSQAAIFKLPCSSLRIFYFVVDLKRGNISIVYVQSGKNNDLFVCLAFLKHSVLTVPALGVGCFFPDLTNSIVLQESNLYN